MSESPFTGFSIPKKNYFHMPNEWTDISAGINNLAELKIIEYLIRHTWGFKEYDGTPKAITTDEFMNGRKRSDGTRMDKGTGLSNKSVIDGLRRAIKDGYLTFLIDDSDKGRIIKSYALNMAELDVKNLNTRCEDVTHQPFNSYIPDVKEVHSSSEESSHRTEKETIERNLEKDTTDTYVNADALTRTPSQETAENENYYQHSDGSSAQDIHSDQPSTDIPIATTKGDTDDHSRQSRLASTLAAVPPALPGSSGDTSHHGSLRPVAGLEQTAQETAQVTTTKPQADVSIGVATRNTDSLPDVTQAATPNKRRGSRKPAAPKDSNAPTQERIEAVYVAFDDFAREVMGDPDFAYARTKVATEHITTLLTSRRVTREELHDVYLKLWNTPPDPKTGFDWKKNMTIKAICNNFERVFIQMKGGIKQNGHNAGVVSGVGVSGRKKVEVPQEFLEAMGGY